MAFRELVIMSNKKVLLLGALIGLLFIFLPSMWPLFGDFTSYLSYLLDSLPTYITTPIIIYSLSLIFYLIMSIISQSFMNKSLLIYYSLGVLISLLILSMLTLIAISQFQFGF